MLAEETLRRQKHLNELIRKLSVKLFSDEESHVRDVLTEMRSIYFNTDGGHSGFRHSYSDFFPLIQEISKDYDLECLSNNLEQLRIFVESDYINQTGHYTNLYQPLRKLCDHLNLEIARWEYYSRNENAIYKTAQDIARLENQSRQAESALASASDKLKSLQTEMVAVLSIFAAVIIGFSGGMNYISSAISSLGKVHIYKSSVIVLIAGIMLFNSLFVLMYLVSKIVERNIYASCKTENCSCKDKCNPLKRVYKRLPYVFWANVFFIVLLSIICFIWFFVGANAPI